MDQIVLQLKKLQAGGTYLKEVSKGLWGCVDEVFPLHPPPPQHYHKHIQKILAIQKIPPPKNKVRCAFQFFNFNFLVLPGSFQWQGCTCSTTTN